MRVPIAGHPHQPLVLSSWLWPSSVQFSSFQSLSCVPLFATPWTAAHQASLSITHSQSLLKLMFIELVMPSNHLILCHPLLLPLQSFPASGSFQMSQLFASGGQRIGVSASASVLWFLLGWIGWISLQSKGLSRVPTPQFKSINSSHSAFFINLLQRLFRSYIHKEEEAACISHHLLVNDSPQSGFCFFSKVSLSLSTILHSSTHGNTEWKPPGFSASAEFGTL